MSGLSKVLLFVAFVALIGGAIGYQIFQQSGVMLWGPMAVFVIGLILALVVDFRFYKDFFSMKTTRHGMSMGTVILLAMVLLAAINFIAVQNNKKWDVTEEKMNTVSEQTSQTLKSLEEPLKIYAFLDEASPQAEQEKQKITAVLQMYKEESSKVSFEMVNPNKRPDLRRKYNVEVSGSVVLVYKGKDRMITDLTEQNLTNAIVKMKKGGSKVVYALAGHGEMDLENINSPTAAAGFFKQALIDATLEPKKLSLVQDGKVPADASVIAILGPQQPLLESEIDLLMQFAYKGGALFIAADPGRRHNIAQLTKRLGIEFENRFIVDPVGVQVQQGPAFVIGYEWSKESEVTKQFKDKTMAGFLMASPLKRAQPLPANLKVEDLVQTGPQVFTTADAPSSLARPADQKTQEPLTLAVAVSGKLEKPTKAPSDIGEAKEFQAVIVGDSDFLSNAIFGFQLNRDFAINAMSYLAKDNELITIRPKELSKQQLVMTSGYWLALLALLVLLPLGLFVSGSVIWFRKRNA